MPAFDCKRGPKFVGRCLQVYQLIWETPKSRSLAFSCKRCQFLSSGGCGCWILCASEERPCGILSMYFFRCTPEEGCLFRQLEDLRLIVVALLSYLLNDGYQREKAADVRR